MDVCLKCKDYKDCTQDRTWFHYGQMGFCPYQILFVLENKATFEAGRWPKDPDGNDSNGQRVVKTEGSFVKPTTILAEVEQRLARTGIHGKLLLAQVKEGRDFNTIDGEAMEALLYVKGWRRKRISFRRWLREIFYKPRKEQ